jgi:hypothetical protein
MQFESNKDLQSVIVQGLQKWGKLIGAAQVNFQTFQVNARRSNLGAAPGATAVQYSDLLNQFSATVPTSPNTHAVYYGSIDAILNVTLAPTASVISSTYEFGLTTIDAFTQTVEDVPLWSVTNGSVIPFSSNNVEVQNQFLFLAVYCKVTNGAGNTGNIQANFDFQFNGYQVTGF